jgi:hypothetical protein
LMVSGVSKMGITYVIIFTNAVMTKGVSHHVNTPKLELVIIVFYCVCVKTKEKSTNNL